MAGTRSCTWLCSVFKVYCRGKGTQAEEVPLLLLPCLAMAALGASVSPSP